jgi:hypothetical protein
MLTFNDAVTDNSVAINPNFVVAVFTASEGEMTGKTVIGLSNGNIVVSQDFLSVVGQLQGQLS